MKLYFIERFNEDSPFDESIGIFEIADKTYDIIRQNSDVGLDRISDCTFDLGGKLFEKVDPREEAQIKAFIETKYGPVNELLLG